MRFFALAVALLALTFTAEAGFKHLHDFEVGKQPSEIFFFGGYYHVFCIGQDLDYNGTYDEGDEYPSWWKIPVHQGSMKAEKVMDLPMGGVQFNTRHAFDATNGVVYISQGSGIVSLDLAKGEVKDDNVYTGSTKGLSLYSNHLFIAAPVTPSKVIVLNRNSKAVQFEAPAGINLQEVLPYKVGSEMGMVALNVGPYTADSSNVMIYKLDHQGEGTTVSSIDTIYVGNTGNHINIEHGMLYVTSNGSHKVEVIDLATKQITKTIETGTSGSNGPRQSKVHGNTLFVTTYNSDLRTFDLTTGSSIETYETAGVPEGLDISNDIVAVANIYSELYSPGDKVSFYQITTSVLEEAFAAKVDVYPNPVTDRAVVKFDRAVNNVKSIAVYSVDGQKVADISTDIAGNSLDQISIDCTEFVAGTYVLNLVANDTMQTIPFVVAK